MKELWFIEPEGGGCESLVDDVKVDVKDLWCLEP